jgi:O-antigen biosynthesis protein
MCITAAAQADMPKTKKHWAFRPLVALLFFLQPITRGWARYRGRLLQSPTPLSHRETMNTLGPQFEGKVFELAQYWTKQPVTRVEFLSAILEELDNHSWPNKADVGWNDYDIEIYGSRWCTLQLTTVAEGHKDGAQLFRCRLKTVPSLLAETVVALTVAFEVLLIGLLEYKALWAVLAFSVVGLYLLLRFEAQDLRRIISVFLDSVAPKLGLTRVELDRVEPVAPVATPAVPKTVL